jgi:ParB-like chromosome segregation protein Spo0J
MGSTFPPIVVCKKGPGYVLIDGLHRMEAFREDDDMIRAQVYPEMTDKDILIKSIELNAIHGNQLVYKDLVHCGIKLEKMGLSIDEIADIVKVVPASLKRDINARSGLKNVMTGKVAYQPNVTEAFKPCPTCKGEGRVPSVTTK